MSRSMSAGVLGFRRAVASARGPWPSRVKGIPGRHGVSPCRRVVSVLAEAETDLRLVVPYRLESVDQIVVAA